MSRIKNYRLLADKSGWMYTGNGQPFDIKIWTSDKARSGGRWAVVKIPFSGGFRVLSTHRTKVKAKESAVEWMRNHPRG